MLHDADETTAQLGGSASQQSAAIHNEHADGPTLDVLVDAVITTERAEHGGTLRAAPTAWSRWVGPGASTWLARRARALRLRASAAGASRMGANESLEARATTEAFIGVRTGSDGVDVQARPRAAEPRAKLTETRGAALAAMVSIAIQK